MDEIPVITLFPSISLISLKWLGMYTGTATDVFLSVLRRGSQMCMFKGRYCLRVPA
jgi:hypothetical protein